MRYSRRRVIEMGAAGLVGAQAVGSVAGADVVGDPVSSKLVDPTPGLRYLVVSMFEFVPFTAAAELVISSPGAYSSASATYAGPIRVPAGSQIREITLGVRVTDASAASFIDPGLQVVVVDQGRFNFGLDMSFSASSDVQTMTAQVDLPVGHGNQLYVTVRLNGTTNAMIVGALIGFEPAPEERALVPIDPTRVYDSRQTEPLFGALTAGQDRTISVADGRDIDGGAVAELDIVPIGASAVSYNLTIANTVDTGFLSVTPGDAPTFKASTINWSTSGLVLANAGIARLDADRQIKVFCGTGATDFIVDVTGYVI